MAELRTFLHSNAHNSIISTSESEDIEYTGIPLQFLEDIGGHLLSVLVLLSSYITA